MFYSLNALHASQGIADWAASGQRHCDTSLQLLLSQSGLTVVAGVASRPAACRSPRLLVWFNCPAFWYNLIAQWSYACLWCFCCCCCCWYWDSLWSIVGSLVIIVGVASRYRVTHSVQLYCLYENRSLLITCSRSAGPLLALLDSYVQVVVARLASVDGIGAHSEPGRVRKRLSTVGRQYSRWIASSS